MISSAPNFFWPVYQNLERSVEALTFSVHVDDDQLGVYSSEIIDLVLRAAAEVESIAKELYLQNGGRKTDPKKIYFDTDAMAHLIQLWQLDEKLVVLTHPNFHLSDAKISSTPAKYDTHTGSGKKRRKDWKWNRAYQALKHDRAKSMKLGTLENLLSVMTTLYLLNLYYRDAEFATDAKGAGLPTGIGSILFSVSTQLGEFNAEGDRNTEEDYETSVYLIDHTRESRARIVAAMHAFNREMHSEGVFTGKSVTSSSDARETEKKVQRAAARSGFHAVIKSSEYIARLNRNDDYANT